MSAYPLLTKVLADMIDEQWRVADDGEMSVPTREWCDQHAARLIRHTPHADRLEQALDVCQRMDPDPAIGQCGETEASEVHHRDLSVWPSESFWAHAYVPLVQP